MRVCRDACSFAGDDVSGLVALFPSGFGCGCAALGVVTAVEPASAVATIVVATPAGTATPAVETPAVATPAGVAVTVSAPEVVVLAVSATALAPTTTAFPALVLRRRLKSNTSYICSSHRERRVAVGVAGAETEAARKLQRETLSLDFAVPASSGAPNTPAPAVSVPIPAPAPAAALGVVSDRAD